MRTPPSAIVIEYDGYAHCVRLREPGCPDVTLGRYGAKASAKRAAKSERERLIRIGYVF